MTCIYRLIILGVQNVILRWEVESHFGSHPIDGNGLSEIIERQQSYSQESKSNGEEATAFISHWSSC